MAAHIWQSKWTRWGQSKSEMASFGSAPAHSHHLELWLLCAYFRGFRCLRVCQQYIPDHNNSRSLSCWLLPTHSGMASYVSQQLLSLLVKCRWRCHQGMSEQRMVARQEKQLCLRLQGCSGQRFIHSSKASLLFIFPKLSKQPKILTLILMQA